MYIFFIEYITYRYKLYIHAIYYRIALDRPHLNEGSVFAFPKKVWI